jgi:uncharacterized protein (TIGR03000 family)
MTISVFRLVQTAVLAASIYAVGATNAMAWSFGRWGSFGSDGSAGSYGSFGGYASYGRYAGYRSSGSYGSYASPGCYISVGYGSRGSYGSSGSTGSTYYSVPIEPHPIEMPPAPPTPDEALQTEATIRIAVPADAKVFVDDRPTASAGTERRFVSRGLQIGGSYAYRMRVEYDSGSEHVVESKLVRLRAGDAIDLTFGRSDQLVAAAQTELTLHVPKNADVTLAGAETSQTGELRRYATSALAEGEAWDNYTVRVELHDGGHMRAAKKTLDIVGGQRYELTFAFADESAKLAVVD